MSELISDDDQRRELAAARLSIIGPRAVTPLLALAADVSRTVATRLSAIEALTAIGDDRAVRLAHALAASPEGDDALAVAAIELLAPVARGKDARATQAFERLASIVTGPDVSPTRRLAALTALEGQPERLLKPLYEALAKDPAARIVARATRRQAGAVEPLEVLVEKGLPGDPDVVAAVVREDGERTSLTMLKRAVEIARAHERGGQHSDNRTRWTAVRGLLHQQLAARGSRLALYDLRESLEDANGPLPVGFLAAAAAIGDTACLTPLAQAWTTTPSDDRWWREHLADAFRAIVIRERLSRRHPVLKKILERWPNTGPLVAMAPR